MEERKAFPLVVWEATEEFRQEYEQARTRFQDINKRLRERGFECEYLGSLRMDQNGNPEVWLNDNRPLMAYKFCRDSKVAIRYALRHGDSGWWSLDELERFANREGRIIDHAMWDIGYRMSRSNPFKWARKGKNDEAPKMYNSQKNIADIITEEEKERLNKLWVLPNERAGLGQTYGLEVGKRDLIYVALWANPFVGTRAETMWQLGAQENDRGHIARQQNGFQLNARNVKLNGQEGIHIRAVKPDESYAECIWPIQTPKEKLYHLASDLVSRVK